MPVTNSCKRQVAFNFYDNRIKLKMLLLILSYSRDWDHYVFADLGSAFPSMRPLHNIVHDQKFEIPCFSLFCDLAILSKISESIMIQIMLHRCCIAVSSY